MANGERTTKRRSAKKVAAMPRRRKSTRSRRKKRFRPGRLLGRLVVAVLLLAVGWWGLGYLRDTLMGTLARTVVATGGTVEQVVSADGWLMPTVAETEVAPRGGVAHIKVPDGERTRVGSCVVELIDSASQRQLLDQLESLDKQLADLKQRNAGDREAATKRLQEIEGLLASKLAELKAVTAKGDQAAIDRLQGELRDLGAEKQALTDKLNALAAAEADLEAKRQQAGDAVSQAAYQMLAMFPGVVAYRFDGLDDALTPEKAVALGSRGLWSLREQVSALKDDQSVEAGQPVFKVIDPATTYIALAVKANQFVELGQGPVTLRFPGFGRATARAEFVSAGQPERNGYLVAVYRTGDFLPEFTQTRRASVEIVRSAGNGLVVPSSALVQRAGQIGVWAVTRGAAHFTPVTVLCNNGIFAAVTGLPEGTEVVKLGRLVIREGQRIK